VVGVSSLRILKLVVVATGVIAVLPFGHAANMPANESAEMRMLAAAPLVVPQETAPPAKPAAQLPAGAGRDVTMRVCSGCHAVSLFAGRRYSQDRWNQVIQEMITRGLDAPDDDLVTISKYLTTNLAPPVDAAPPADSVPPVAASPK
jgi:cytochrome c5